MRRLSVQKNTVQKSTLYSVVFDAVAVRYVVAFMFMFFVMHPAVPAFASEDVSVENQEEPVSAPEPEVVTEPELEPEPEEIPVEEFLPEASDEEVSEEAESVTETEDAVEGVSDEEVVEEIQVESEDVPVETEEEIIEQEVTGGGEADVLAGEAEGLVEEDESEADTAPSSGGSSSGSNVEESEDENMVDDTQDTTEVDEENTEETELEALSKLLSTSTTETQQEEQVAGVSTSTDDVIDDGDSVEETVTESENQDEVTQEVITETEETQTVAEEEAEEIIESEEVPEAEYVEVQNIVTHTGEQYQFQKSQCMSMGDGGYYCADLDEAVSANLQEDSLYAALDNEGDLEIYIRTDGEVTQVTDNSYDDAAPSYDPVSDSIVWHRLIKGRYQIVAFEDDEETLVTTSSNNSMEPQRSGDYTVWQEWVDDNWEVMLFDGDDIVQITESSTHEVAPYIQGEYVIWTTTDGSESFVTVYDIATGLMSSIDDSEGGRVENPRFVLVYDTKFDNGDVVTKGFDPETGEVMPLSAQPAPTPTEIPSSDSTGETRALIQNKSTSREDFAEEITGNTASTSEPVASTTDAVSEDNSQELLPDTEAVDMSTSTSSEVLPLTDFDIIVEPFSASSSAQDSGSASSTEAVE